jgi:membrane associated rhomboid family serine protease
MLYIAGLNLLSYLLMQMDRSGAFFLGMLFSPDLILQGQIWRLVTWIILPNSNNVLLLAISLYFYYFLAQTLEREWGTGRFTIYYLAGILLNVVFGFVLWLAGVPFLLLNAQYLNLSLFFTFAVMFPELQVRLFFILPIKVKWLALVDVLYYGYVVITSPFPMNLLPLIGIANFLLFCWDDLYQTIRGKLPRNVVRRAKYNNAAKPSAKFDFADRKCAVCGKSAASHPELEFRYCSRCEGFHCFCEEHINSHIHFDK